MILMVFGLFQSFFLYQALVLRQRPTWWLAQILHLTFCYDQKLTSISFFDISKVFLLSTYHAEFQILISTRSAITWAPFSDFGLPAITKFKYGREIYTPLLRNIIIVIVLAILLQNWAIDFSPPIHAVSCNGDGFMLSGKTYPLLLSLYRSPPCLLWSTYTPLSLRCSG